MNKEQRELITNAYDCIDTLVDNVKADDDNIEGEEKIWQIHMLLTELYLDHCIQHEE